MLEHFLLTLPPSGCSARGDALFQQLARVSRALEKCSTSFDPALVSAREAARIRDEASRIKTMAAAIESKSAARVAETSMWKRSGARSAAHELAAKTGTSVAQARNAIETGRILRELSATDEALCRGEISMEQATLVAGAAQADPEAETRLLEATRKDSIGELRDTCARVKANASDLEARRRRIHEQRSLRSWTDGSGTGHLHVNDNPEKIAEIVASLEPTRDQLFKQAREDGRREQPEAYAADALYQKVCRPRSGPKQNGTTKMLVRVDLLALLRGYPTEDEVCEVAGFGPIAVSAVHELLETGAPFLAAIATKGKEVTGVAHLGRRPTAHQRSALEWLYPTCAAEGCNSLTYLEIDHREDWADTKVTVFDLLDRLCSHHHDLKTRDCWALEEGTGKRAFVPPVDPRHPRYRGPLAAA